MGSQHDLAAMLLNPSPQSINDGLGTPHGIVNGAARPVPLHQHERHFSTDGVFGQHSTAQTTQHTFQPLQFVTLCKHAVVLMSSLWTGWLRPLSLHQHNRHFGANRVFG